MGGVTGSWWRSKGQRAFTSDFWIYQWIDEYEITTIDGIERALSLGKPFERAIELAETAASSPPPPFPSADAGVPGEATVVAGRALDLSGMLSCNQVGCMLADAERLASTVGHYFDRVVVDSLGAKRALSDLQTYGGEAVNEALRTHATVLLYLRDIGAEPMLRFQEKPFAFCADHFREHAEEVGLPATVDDALAQSIVRYLAETIEIEERESDDESIVYHVGIPQLGLGRLLSVPRDKAPPDVGALAQQLYVFFCVATMGDAGLAMALEAPLTSNAAQVLKLPSTTASPVEDDVALSLNFPLLTGLPARELLALRHEHQPEFEKFRAALLEAIKDRAADAGSVDPQRTAGRVMREYIRPALADIEARLTTSSKTLMRKSALNVTLASAAVTVGLLGGLPLLVGSGAATSLAVLSHATRFIDEKRDVELADMYFLWRLTQHDSH